MLGAIIPMDKVLTVATVRWSGQVLQNHKGDILKALNFKVIRKRKEDKRLPGKTG